MTTVMNFIHGGGFVMYPLLLIAVAAVGVIFERAGAFRLYGSVPEGLLKQVLALARKGQYDQAKKLLSSSKGPLAACLYVILNHRNLPTRELERLVEETGQDYFLRLEYYLPVLDTTTTIAPLLGLLGTIVGMIGAFNAIASQSHHGDTDSVLAGVGSALYATATGLVVAVICFCAYNYFASRIRNITAATEQGSTKLINVLMEARHEERPGHHSEHQVETVAVGGHSGVQN
jgi:biopolymer transport protein ExbB